MARTLFIDIETTPIIGYSWGPDWKTNLLGHVEHSHLLSAAYRWGEDGETEVRSLRQYGRTYGRSRRDDSMLAKEIWGLLDEADIVVAHNGIDFDVPKLNTRFAANGLPAPSPFRQVDTRRAASKVWRNGSNKLNDLCGWLGIGTKTPHTGFQLWLDVMDGDPEAWELMELYNLHDVDLLVGLYQFMRNGGWLLTHPNVSTIDGDAEACRVCGSHDLMKRGYHYTQVNTYQQYQCRACNSYSRSRHAIVRAPAERLV